MKEIIITITVLILDVFYPYLTKNLKYICLEKEKNFSIDFFILV